MLSISHIRGLSLFELVTDFSRSCVKFCSHKLEPRDRDVSKNKAVLNKYSSTITQLPSAGAAQAQCKYMMATNCVSGFSTVFT